MTCEDIGRVVQMTRRQLGLRQQEVASLCGVGNRFLSELENGKPGLEIGRVIRVLESLGLELVARSRTHAA